MVTTDQIMQVLDSSNYFEQISYEASLRNQKKLTQHNQELQPTYFLRPIIPYNYFRAVINNYAMNDFVTTTMPKIVDKREMLVPTHPELIPTVFYRPLAGLTDFIQSVFDNQLQDQLNSTLIAVSTMKHIGQIIDTSFLMPVVLAPLRTVIQYAEDNAFITWLAAKIQPKESLVAIHVEPTSFLRPITVFNYFKAIIENYEMNDFFATMIAKINTREKPLVAIHTELIPTFRTLIKSLPGKIRGLLVRLDFTNPKDPYQGDFDVDL